MNSFNEPTEKTGYLEQDFRLFHIKDQTKREFSYHYHDFHKVIIFLSGKAAYHIEGKSYYLKPWDILLVNHVISFWSVRARSTNRKLIFRFHTNVLYYGSATTSNPQNYSAVFRRRLTGVTI